MTIRTPKKICFVVGQHRSGTSALTGLLQIFGGSLGSGYVHEQDIFNEKGYFENKAFETFNEKVFARFNTYWSNPEYFCYDIEQTDDTTNKFLIQELNSIIDKEMADVPVDGFLVVKDPRISLLMDLYQQALAENENQYDVSYIFSQRDIQENIDSIVKRGSLNTVGPDGTSTMTNDWASKIVSNHSRAFEETIDADAQFVYHTFSNLFYDLKKYFTQIKDILGLPLNINKETLEQASAFLDKNLKHHTTNKTSKVIATYFGGRRRYPNGFQETKKMWEEEILPLELTINSGDAMDTIVVHHDHGDKEAKEYIRSLDGRPTRFGVIKTIVRSWEDGVGASFKSFDYAYKLFREEYVNWIFNEDNVFIVDSGYLISAKKQFVLDNKVAFLGMMRCDAREPVVENEKVVGGRLYSSDERQEYKHSIWHAHGGCGFTTREYLDKIIQELGHLPYAKTHKPGTPGDGLHEEHPWYRSCEQNGEVMFTAIYHLLGYKVLEINHPNPITYYKYDNSYA